MTFCGTSSIYQVLDHRPKKSLGQNFLTDTNIADWIVEQADIQPQEKVLEIGPGTGILTERLKKITQNIVAIELDRKLAEHIEERYRIEIILGDAVQVDLPEFDKVVSNLPYQISSPITFKLLDQDFKKGVLMFQKEFAQHLVAEAGERAYSRISVMADWKANCRIIKHVPRGCFNPVPKVDSAVVEITPRKAEFDVLDEKCFKTVVRALFSHKNRKARNGIMAEHKALGLEKDAAKGLAEKIPYNDRRPVTLVLAQLAEISNYIFEN